MHGGHGYWVIWRRCVEFEPDTENRPVIPMRDCQFKVLVLWFSFLPGWNPNNIILHFQLMKHLLHGLIN